ncbi:MAG TPA: AI-2E family transporter [Thermodesulfovibrionales bacterium]|nr:AI-2E family transporter [Thermodesulfovibrionales bacterium]
MSDEGHQEDLSLTDARKLHHQMPRWVIVLLVAGLAGVVASHIAHLLVTLLIAALAAYILSSAISALERLGLRRSVAVIMLFVVVSAFAIAADLVFVPDLKQEIMNAYTKLPEFSRRIEGALLSSAERSAGNSPLIEANVRKLAVSVFGQDGLLERALNISEILVQAPPFVMGLILVPFFVFFLLKDWPGAMKRIMEWVPPSYVETTIAVIGEINILVGKYLRGLAADCFFIGVLASLGLWLVGINYPITLGILSGAVNIVPYLGPLIACSVSCLVALMQFNSFEPVLNVIVLYIFLKLADDLLIQPLMIGKSVKLHPMLLVITIIVGEKLFGIIGMILGVPVVTAAQKTVGILLEHRREMLRKECTGQFLEQRLDESPVRPI